MWPHPPSVAALSAVGPLFAGFGADAPVGETAPTPSCALSSAGCVRGMGLIAKERMGAYCFFVIYFIMRMDGISCVVSPRA